MEVYLLAVKAHPGAWHAHPKEPSCSTWVHGGSPWGLEAHPGPVEVYLGAVEPQPGALEAHPGALGADLGSMEAYYKTEKISDLLRTPVSSMWTYVVQYVYFIMSKVISHSKKNNDLQ